jgi:signal transduction histidine kinase
MLSNTPIQKPSRLTPVMMSVIAGLVAMLILVGLAMEWLGQQARFQVEQANDLRIAQSTAYGLLVDMQTSMRGYIITGDEKFLEPYNSAIPRLPQLWAELTRLATELDSGGASGSAMSRPLVEEMQRRADSWQREVSEPLIGLRRQGRVEEATGIVASGRGNDAFNSVREAASQVDQRASEILQSRNQDLERTRTVELWLLIGLGIFAFTTAIVTMRVVRADAKLQASARHAAEMETQRLVTILGNLPVAVRLLAPPDGDCIIQNRAASLLFPREKWNSLTAEERLTYFGLAKPDGTRPSLDESPVIRTLREGATILEYEFLMNSPETGPRNLLGSTSPLRDSEGNITAAVMVVQDVTRMKEMDQRKDEFIATAAHELRNPLAALSGYTQLAQRMATRADVPSSVTRHLTEMGKLIKRLNVLVEHLLDTSRIQLGRLVLAKTEFDLVELVEAVAANVRATDANAHTIEVQAEPQRIVGQWDPIRLEQVVSNLLSNAVRYSPPGTEVKIRVEQVESCARVKLTDQGPGVPESARGHLFERYYQTSTLNPGTVANNGQTPHPTTRKGLGLGLYISSEIVKAHGGQIGMEPNPEGGSIFWFAVPRVGGQRPETRD